MSTSSSLTDEQRRRIEENRRKALEKRAARLNEGKSSSALATRISQIPNTRTFPQKPLSSSKTSVHTGNGHPSNFSSNASSSSTSKGPDTNKTMKDFVSQFSRPTSTSNTFNKNKPLGVDKLFQSNNNKPAQTFQQKNISGYSSSNVDCTDNVQLKAGPSKGPIKVVKGTCVLLNKKRFVVKVPFHGPLIGLFKTIPSRNYGNNYYIRNKTL